MELVPNMVGNEQEEALRDTLLFDRIHLSSHNRCVLLILRCSDVHKTNYNYKHQKYQTYHKPCNHTLSAKSYRNHLWFVTTR